MFSATEIRLILASMAVSFVLVNAMPMKLVRAYIAGILKLAVNDKTYALIYDGMGCIWCVGFWVGTFGAMILNYGIVSLVYGCATSILLYIIKGILSRWQIML